MQKTFVSSLARMALVSALAALSVPAAAQLPAPRPLAVNAGPLGVLQASGWVSGAALTANPQPAGGTSGTNLTNAFVILQKTTGEWRFYLQAGVYSLPALGAQRKSTSAYTGLFGPVPQAYGEWRPDAHWNLQAGLLPSLTGEEGTFTYTNFNIQRGVIWADLENDVSRAAQLNYQHGRWAAALQYGDGFFSRDFGAASAMVQYQVDAADSAALVALWPNRSTPPNPSASIANARLLNLLWTRHDGRWTWEPYLVLFHSPSSRILGYSHPANAAGAAILADYRWSRHWSLGARGEFAAGGMIDGATAHQNVLGFGPGARVFTFTLTPTWQDGGLFARADVSWVELAQFSPGLGFGAQGRDGGQFGAAMEAGVAF